MKNRIIILLAVVIITPIFFIGCEEELDTPPIATVNPDLVLNISDIYQIYADSGEYTFNDNYMLYATVTLNDYEGNLYKEAYVQDSTGGINLYDLSHSEVFDIGDFVRINLNNAKVTLFKGKMELVFTDILDFREQMVVQESGVIIEPDSVSIADILTGGYTNKLVKVYDVQFADGELSNAYCVEIETELDEEPKYDMNRDLVDCNGGSMIVRTSSYASFAEDTVAQGKGTIIAIATLYQNSGSSPIWQLLLRSTEEVDMEGSRCN